MNKALILFIILLSSLTPLSGQNKKIRFITDESPPYTINGKNENDYKGFMVDIVHEVFEKLGFQVEIKFAPYKRSIQEIYRGNADGVLLLSPNSAPDFIFLKNPIYIDHVVFFTAKNSDWKYEGISSLSGKRIASGLGFDFADPEINEYIAKMSRERSPLLELISGEDINLRNFTKLLMGRTDVVIATEAIGVYVARQNNLSEKLKIAGKAKVLISAQTGFNPNDPDGFAYAEMLSHGVSELKKSGRINEIFGKYGLNGD